MTSFSGIATAMVLAFAALAPAYGQSSGQTLNFREAEIGAVIDDMALMTGYTFVVDPEVRGRVSIVSQTPLTSDEAFQVFLSTLRVNGYTALPMAPGVYQIIPATDGVRMGAPLSASGSDSVVLSSVYRLQNAAALDAVRAIVPMLSEYGAANSIASGNLVVIVDFVSNVRAIEAALREVDRDTSTVEMLTLENVPAEEMAEIIGRLQVRSQSSEREAPANITMAAVPSSNALLLRGEPAAVGEMVSLVRRIDAVSASNQTFRVVALNHARGDDLLPILEQFTETMNASDTGGRPVSIAHHPATNAIIMNADPDVLRDLEQVIRRLDVRRPQVQVEAIVVEISDQTARDLGVQFLLAGDGDDATPFAYTRYGSTRQPDLLALTGALLTGGLTSDGDSTSSTDVNLRNLALSSLVNARGGAFGFGGELNDGSLFGVIVNALDTDSDSNVLSKPQLMVLDNEEANLMVGQEIPITTGEALGSNNANPFRQIERESVGVQLYVRPQINDGNAIRLQIRQEVSSVAGPVSADFVELITNQRKIETTVLADDGEIIVLGGLIETDEQEAESGVPGLSRIPGAGRLFRNDSRSTTRRNLMVFIRPTIVRDAASMRDVTRSSYDYAVGQQRDATGGESSLESIVDMMMGGGDPFARPLPDADAGQE